MTKYDLIIVQWWLAISGYPVYKNS